MTADRNNGILTKNIIHEITKTGAPSAHRFLLI